VDDVVVSAFLAARGVRVRDVPGFSFEPLPASYSRFRGPFGGAGGFVSTRKARKWSQNDMKNDYFRNRPWSKNSTPAKYLHHESKVRRLRGPARTEQNALCHDKLIAKLDPEALAFNRDRPP